MTTEMTLIENYAENHMKFNEVTEEMRELKTGGGHGGNPRGDPGGNLGGNPGGDLRG